MSDWGKGAKNNTVGYGQGACDNSVGWGQTQKDSSVAQSWSGDTDISGCSGGGSGLAQIDNVYSMSFDGSSDYIDIGLRPKLSATEFTWSFWIYPTSTSGTRAIYSQSSPVNFQQTGYLAINGATLALDVWLTGTYSTGPNFVTLNEWQHIVATRDSSNIVRLYRNGVVFNSAGQAQAGGGQAANGYIGSWIYDGPPVSRGLYFGGKIDEGALFNVALTDSQILSIYNGTAIVGGVNKTADLNGLPTPPIKWYRMGD